MVSRPARPAIGDARQYRARQRGFRVGDHNQIPHRQASRRRGDRRGSYSRARRTGFVPLPVSFVHGQAAAALSGPLEDPFDRTLIAQAMLDRMAVVSNEHDFAAYGARRCGSAAIAYPSHTLLGIGNEANASSPSGWSGSTPAMRSSIIHCRTCWPDMPGRALQILVQQLRAVVCLHGFATGFFPLAVPPRRPDAGVLRCHMLQCRPCAASASGGGAVRLS